MDEAREFLSKILPREPTEEEIRAFHETKPVSREDVMYAQELYNAIVGGDGTYFGAVMHEREQKPQTSFSTMVKGLINKVLGNDKTDEEIEAYHEYKMSPKQMKQLSEIFETVELPTNVETVSSDDEFHEAPENFEEDEPSSSGTQKKASTSGTKPPATRNGKIPVPNTRKPAPSAAKKPKTTGPTKKGSTSGTAKKTTKKTTKKKSKDSTCNIM